MAWRGVHLTKPARLSLADGQIVVGQADGEHAYRRGRAPGW